MFRIFAALSCVALWCAQVSQASEVQSITLDEVIARALKASTTLQAQEERIGGADAGIRQSRTMPNPELQAELENFAGSGPYKSLNDSEITVSVSQTIERSSKRDGRAAVAMSERDIAIIERDNSRLEVVTQARRLFFEACAAYAILGIRRDQLQSAKQIEEMALRRVLSARDPETVKLRAEMLRVEAEGAIERATIELDSAKKSLASLMGDPAAVINIETGAFYSVPEEFERHAVELSPEVRVKDAAARRAASKVELQNANAGSDVSVGLGVRRFESGNDIAGIVSLSVPLAVFDTNQGNIDQAAAEHRAATLDAVEARRSAEREALSLQTAVKNLRAEALAIRALLLPRAEEAVRVARRGYDAGAFSYLELSESQRALLELRVREVEVLRELHISVAALDRLSSRDISINQGQQP